MSLNNGNVRWIRRGRQRAAVAQVLRKPMTTTEICAAAKRLSPQIQLRDIWLILQEMRERGLIICLNPKHTTGKLYALAERGRRVVLQSYGSRVPRISGGVDWPRYAKVVRAKVRRIVLLELANSPDGLPPTAAQVRKRVNAHHPLGLNPAIRALKDLESIGAIRASKVGADDSRRTYRLTPTGKRLAQQLVL